MLIYSFNNKLFIHSETILRTVRIGIYNKGKPIKEYKISDTDFFSCTPDLKPDYYQVKIFEGNKIIEEKRVYLTNNNEKIQR